MHILKKALKRVKEERNSGKQIFLENTMPVSFHGTSTYWLDSFKKYGISNSLKELTEAWKKYNLPVTCLLK